MDTKICLRLASLLTFLTACSSDGGGRGSGNGSGLPPTGSGSGDGSGSDGNGTGDASDSGTSGGGSGGTADGTSAGTSDGGDNSTGGGPGSTGGDPGSTGGVATDSGSTGGMGSGSSTGGVDPTGGSTTTGGGGPRFDVGAATSAGGDTDGDCPTDADPTMFDFSYIWIANSPEGTVSKIDTVTAAEVARYRTGPGAPDPSRTSVNLEGDVAVLNRAGSVAKIVARLDDCVDQNGNMTIETSTGPTDVLPWGQDECVVWHTELDYTTGGGPRSIAWNSGDPAAACAGTEADVWVGFRNDPTAGKIRRLDGATGAIEDMVDVANWNQIYGQGLYGGAMDGDGNFWVIGKGGTLLRMNTTTLQQDRWEQAPPNGTVETFYGFAVSAEGHPWIVGQSGHLYHFDPGTETFDPHGPFDRNYMGMAIDREGFAWMAFRTVPSNSLCGVTKFDLMTEMVVDHVDLEGCIEPVGVSIDVEGFVWVVDMSANRAYKVHPDTYDTIQVTGLTSPYTYSDMTGAGLRLVTIPPG